MTYPLIDSTQAVSTRHPDVVIIGAGASGLMCAATAAKRGLNVLVLEKANKVGKKILMSGGGKCNFTNYDVRPEHFISQNPHFCKSALSQYTQWDFFSLVNEYAIEWEERKHGQLFCRHSAKDILNMLLAECQQQAGSVSIKTRQQIEQITYADGLFLIDTETQQIRSKQLVIATGALSIPTLGGSGFGYQLAQQFQLPLVPRRAGLVPFTFTDQLKHLCSTLSGLAIDVGARCGEAYFRENLLFTHRGMSGPVALQISNYWQPGQAIELDLLPEQNASDLLLQAKQQQAKSGLKALLSPLLSKKLVRELLQMYWPEYQDKSLAEIPDKRLMKIADSLNCWQIKPADTEGYRTAEVTLGGVSTEAVSSKSFVCKHQPGLYFIGEVLDVTGHLGGYNFQWAWSSGYACGTHLMLD